MFFFSILIAKVSIILQSAIFLLKKVQKSVCFSWKRGSLSPDTHYIITKIVTSLCGVTIIGLRLKRMQSDSFSMLFHHAAMDVGGEVIVTLAFVLGQSGGECLTCGEPSREGSLERLHPRCYEAVTGYEVLITHIL